MPDGPWTLLAIPIGVIGAHAVLWLLLALHELAHAGTCALLGGRVARIQIGAGRRVWPLWIGATLIELRPGLDHGLAEGVFVSSRGFRWRSALFLLAGPLSTTAVAAPWLWWLVTSGVRPGASLDAMSVYWLCWLGAPATAVRALAAWLPGSLRIGRYHIPSDVSQLRGLLRMTDDDIAAVVAGCRIRAREQLAWSRFLRGDPVRALAVLRSIEVDSAYHWALHSAEAMFVWPLEGPRVALAHIAAAEDGLARALPTQLTSAQQREFRDALAINRLFFLLQADDPAATRAAEAVAAQLSRAHREPAALRTYGLYCLHRGEVRRGLGLLREAFALQEPPWLRGLCALYLAWGEALSGAPGRARRLLRKAARLGAPEVALDRYRPLAERAVAAVSA